MYSDENCVCGVTQDNIQSRNVEKISDHGGSRAYDQQNASSMLCQMPTELRVRLIGIALG